MKHFLLILALLSFRAEAIVVSGSSEALEPMFREFTRQTGIAIDLVKEPIEKVDLVFSANITAQYEDQVNLKTAPFPSRLYAQVAQSLQFPGVDALPVGFRLRTLISRVGTEVPSSYEDLASPKFRGKLCMRDLSHDYNETMFALLLMDGVDVAKVVAGIKENTYVKAEGY